MTATMDPGERRKLRHFLSANVQACALAVPTALAIYLRWRLSDWMLVVIGVLVAKFAVDGVALLRVEVAPATALVTFAVGELVAGVIIVALVPLAALVAPITCVLPLVLAVPYLDTRAVRRLGAATVAAGLVIVGLGRLPGLRLQDATPAWIQRAVLFFFVPFVMTIAALAVRHNHIGMHGRIKRLRSVRLRLVASGETAGLALGAALARDVHPHLAAATARLSGADGPDPASALTAAAEEVAVGLAELRSLAHRVYPVELADFGLERALAGLVRRAHGNVRLDARLHGRPGEEAEAALYFACADVVGDVAPEDDAVLAVRDDEGLRFTLSVTVVGRPDGSWPSLTLARDPLEALGGGLDLQRERRNVAVLTGWLPAGGPLAVPDADAPAVDAATVTRRADARMASLYRTNRWLAVQSFVFGLATLAMFGMDGWVLALCVAILGEVGALTLALCLLTIGCRRRASLVTVAAFWTCALAMTAVIPQTIQYTPFLVLIPLVLGMRFLSSRWLSVLNVAAFAMIVALLALGLLQDGARLNERYPSWVLTALLLNSTGLAIVGLWSATMHNHRHALAHSEALRQELRHVVHETDRARRRLERDLHDGAQQQLVAVAVHLRTALRTYASNPALAHLAIAAARDHLHAGMQELVDLARGQQPAVLRTEGLRAALEVVAARSPMRTTVTGDATRMAAESEAALYFVALEAIQNCVKHGGPDVEVHVHVRVDRRAVVVVRDDGPGFDLTDAVGGLGLRNMRERMVDSGGTLRLTSRPGAGTTVTAELPNDPAPTDRAPRRAQLVSGR